MAGALSGVTLILGCSPGVGFRLKVGDALVPAGTVTLVVGVPFVVGLECVALNCTLTS